MLFTPNLPGAEQAVGYAITRGEEGMSLFDRAGFTQHIPAFSRTEVFDVTGAGDTVVTALTLGLTAGASFWEAAVLGNLAASIVVRQFGTTTTTPTEMKAALQALLDEAGTQ